MLIWVLAFLNSAVLASLPFATKWLEARLTEKARESAEKALADYQAVHQRSLQDYGLYAQKRYEVYPELYGRYRKACDALASLYGVTYAPDFSRYSREDAVMFFEENKLPPRVTAPILASYDRENRQEAARLLQELERRLKRHKAEMLFQEAVNFEALNELFLSDPVIAQVDVVRRQSAKFMVHSEEPEPGQGVEILGMRRKMQADTDTLLRLMRDELRRGELTGRSQPSLPEKLDEASIPSPPAPPAQIEAASILS